jgi:hypothetical protein
MDARILDPFQWANTSGALVFYGVMTVILIGAGLKLVGARWDDWLDERWGRGSVRDYWLLREIERDRRRPERSRT